MELVVRRIPPEVLDRAKESADLVTHCERVRTGRKRVLWMSVFGHVLTGEIFVEMTDGCLRKVSAFSSRHRAFPPELRRQQLPLVDIADAFQVARQMAQTWGGPTRKPFP